MKRFMIVISILFCYQLESSGQMRVKTDLVLVNAKIYTADKNFTIAEAFAVKDGKFIELEQKRIFSGNSLLIKLSMQGETGLPRIH